MKLTKMTFFGDGHEVLSFPRCHVIDSDKGKNDTLLFKSEDISDCQAYFHSISHLHIMPPYLERNLLLAPGYAKSFDLTDSSH